MARLASGVAVVACLDSGKPRGLLVSSMTSLSVNPSRILFCVDKNAGAHDALMRAERCALSVLSERDAAEARRFSTPGLGESRFRSGAWRLAPGEPPVHETAVISMTGTISQQTDARSHTVFFLDVATIDTADEPPLIYFDRTFRALHPTPLPT